MDINLIPPPCNVYITAPELSWVLGSFAGLTGTTGPAGSASNTGATGPTGAIGPQGFGITGTSLVLASIVAGTGTFISVIAGTGTISNLSATTGFINNLSSNNAVFTDTKGGNVSYSGNMTGPLANLGSVVVNNLTGNTGYISSLTVGQLNTNVGVNNLGPGLLIEGPGANGAGLFVQNTPHTFLAIGDQTNSSTGYGGIIHFGNGNHNTWFGSGINLTAGGNALIFDPVNHALSTSGLNSFTFAGSGSFTSLNVSTTGSFASVTATNNTLTNVTCSNLTGTTANFITLNASTGFINTFSTNSEAVTNSIIGNLSLSGSLTGASASLTNISCSNITGGTGSFVNLSVNGVPVNTSNPAFLTVSSLTGGTGAFTTLNASTGFINAFSSNNAVLTNSTIGNLSLSGNLTGTSASLSNLTVNGPLTSYSSAGALNVSLVSATGPSVVATMYQPTISTGTFDAMWLGQSSTANHAGGLFFNYNYAGAPASTGNTVGLAICGQTVPALKVNSIGKVTTINNTMDDGSGNAMVAGALQIGSTFTMQLGVSGSLNIIQSRNNGAVSNLQLNPSGGETLTTHNVLDDGNGNMNINSTNGGTSQTPLFVSYPSLANNAGIYMQIGTAQSTNNAGAFGYVKNATLANSSTTMSVFGSTNTLAINGAGVLSTKNVVLDDASGNMTVNGNNGGYTSGAGALNARTSLPTNGWVSTFFAPSLTGGQASSVGLGIGAVANQAGIWNFYNATPSNPLTIGAGGTSTGAFMGLNFYGAGGASLYLGSSASLAQQGVYTKNVVLDDGSGGLSAGNIVVSSITGGTGSFGNLFTSGNLSVGGNSFCTGALGVHGASVTSFTSPVAQIGTYNGGLGPAPSATTAFLQGSSGSASSGIGLQLQPSGGAIYTSHSTLDDGGGNMALISTATTNKAVLSLTAPSLATGNAIGLSLNVNATSNNNAFVGLNYTGSANTNNYVYLGIGTATCQLYPSGKFQTAHTILDDGGGNQQSNSLTVTNGGAFPALLVSDNGIQCELSSGLTGPLQLNIGGGVVQVGSNGLQLVGNNLLNSSGLTVTLPSTTGTLLVGSNYYLGSSTGVSGGDLTAFTSAKSQGVTVSGTTFTFPAGTYKMEVNVNGNCTANATLSTLSFNTLGSTTSGTQLLSGFFFNSSGTATIQATLNATAILVGTSSFTCLVALSNFTLGLAIVTITQLQ